LLLFTSGLDSRGAIGFFGHKFLPIQKDSPARVAGLS
jgi:hypothetical protein